MPQDSSFIAAVIEPSRKRKEQRENLSQKFRELHG